MALLLALLESGGSVVGKQALLQAAWGNAAHTSDASLNTAMSKLRAALGEPGRSLIAAVHGAGYRITAPVSVEAAPRSRRLRSTLASGDFLPGQPQWRLDHAIGTGAHWLATHEITGDRMVFECSDTEEGLAALRRKASIAASLAGTLGARDDLLPVVAINFEIRPFFLGRPYSGESLSHWAAQSGGLQSIDLESRIGIMTQVASTVAAAHAAGALHGALCADCILLTGGPAGVDGTNDTVRMRLAAFGGVPESPYAAPEILAGGLPSASADVFALGVLLYQVVTGDLRRPLAAGWEAEIEDEALRQDIGDTAAGDPARRAASSAGLAERLANLPARRQALHQLRREAARAALLSRQAERSRQRRPWIAASALSLAAGLAVATWFGVRASHDRDAALRRAELAQAVNAFLTEDLLGRGNPARSGKPDETLMEAAEAAESSIDRRLATEPQVAASIYLAMAHAFDSRSTFSSARHAYGQAMAAFARSGDPADAAIAGLQQAMMECVSGEKGSLPRARALIASSLPLVPRTGARRPEIAVWLSASQALLAMMDGDFAAAQVGFRQASDRADAMPAQFDEGTRLLLRRRYAVTFLRMGAWRTADALLSALLRQELALNGPRHPDTLQVALNLDQARLGSARLDEARADLDRLFPIFTSVFGETHRVTLDLLATRAQVLLHLERYEEALADQTAIYRAAVAKSGEHSFKALAAKTDLAETTCRAGHAEAGLAASRAAFEGARSTYGEAAALTGATAGNLAFCLIVAGQVPDAAPYLSMIGPATLAQMAMDPAYAAEISLMRAQIALDAGETAQADTSLAQALPVFARQGADPYLSRWAERLSASRAQR